MLVDGGPARLKTSLDVVGKGMKGEAQGTHFHFKGIPTRLGNIAYRDGGWMETGEVENIAYPF